MDVPSPRAGVRTVLVAEDHPIVRERLRRTLASQPDLELCAEASDGEEALRVIERYRPDVVVLDVGLSKVGGLDVLRVVRERYPATLTLLVSSGSDPAVVDLAIQLGADGFVLKGTSPEVVVEEVVEAIREVANGGIYW